MKVCELCGDNEGCNKDANNNLLLLSIQKIAAWQLLFDDSELIQYHQRIVLPALQRGSVWKPKQVELLWDSLMRGFPTGSFLLAPYSKFLNKKETKYLQHGEAGVKIDHHFHLLDGQQRANAIALGFIDPWIINKGQENDSKWPPAVLWLDLAPPKDRIGSREFVFRIITRSHPWGYHLSNPDDMLGAAAYRKAIHSFEEANKGTEGLFFKPCKLALKYAWPWDAIAPVPFSFLIEVSQKDFDPKNLLNRLKSLPFWEKWDKKDKVEKSVNDLMPDSEPLASVKKLLIGRIPALVMKIDDKEELNGGNDAVEELFIRVNAGGTKLEGEELIYSILKSVMPSVHHMVEKAATGIMPPSRLVSIAVRVYQARIRRNSKEKESPPEIPSVASFRRMINALDEKREGLEKFISEDELGSLIKRAVQILDFKKSYIVQDSTTKQVNDCGLPRVIMTDLARNSSDFFFYLLVWLDIHKDIEPDRESMIGFLTTLHWFSTDKRRCLLRLWSKVENKDAWESNILCDLLPNDEDRRLLLLPIPPQELIESINKYLKNLDEKMWRLNRWEFINHLTDRDGGLVKWIINQNIKFTIDDEADLVHKTEGLKDFMNRLLDQKGLLLYAQRQYLVNRFPDYDPSSLDQQDDSARPWDYDHIHPHYYTYGRWSIPQLIKTFHSTNGNYRAWPMEENRSDQKDCPKCKLGGKEKEDLRADSFIEQHAWDNDWEKSLPVHEKDKCESIYAAYLADNTNNDYLKARECLLRAILVRNIAIYAEWYDTLNIGKLFAKSDDVITPILESGTTRDEINQ